MSILKLNNFSSTHFYKNPLFIGFFFLISPYSYSHPGILDDQGCHTLFKIHHCHTDSLKRTPASYELVPAPPDKKDFDFEKKREEFFDDLERVKNTLNEAINTGDNQTIISSGTRAKERIEVARINGIFKENIIEAQQLLDEYKRMTLDGLITSIIDKASLIQMGESGSIKALKYLKSERIKYKEHLDKSSQNQKLRLESFEQSLKTNVSSILKPDYYV